MKHVISLVFIFTIVLTDACFAVTWTTVASGNWSNPSIWNRTGGIKPNDDVVINHTVTLDVNAKISNLTINGVLTNTSRTLDVRGNFDAALGTYNESGTGYTLLSGGSASIRYIAGTIYFNRLVVDALGKSIAISSGSSVYIKNLLNLNAGTFNTSSGTFVFMSDATNKGRLGSSPNGLLKGNYIWQNYMDRCNEWSNYAAPVDATFNDYASNTGGYMIFTGFPDSDYPSFSFVNAYFYDEAAGYIVPSSANQTIPRGSGFWYWNSDDVWSSTGTSIPQQWTIQLTGSINLANTFSFNVGYGTTNFNFLGNPYPGTIDWGDADFTKTNLNNAIYVFNTCTQNYASYVNGIGTNGGSRYITPGQSFWVEANAANPALTSTTGVVVDNYVTLKSNATPKAIFLELNSDEIAVSLDDNATNAFDGNYDAKFQLSYTSSLYTFSESEYFSINTLKNEAQIVPVYSDGDGELFFRGASEFSEYDVFLEDLETGEMIDMKANSSYVFAKNSSNFVHRFNVHFKNPPLSVNATKENAFSVYPNPFTDVLHVSSAQAEFSKIELYNTLGALMYRETINSANNKAINLSELNHGVYILKIYSHDNAVSSYLIQK
ncbi:MAG: T9SS type A sorting domain-containing protein [Bacteroidia bacterium]